MSKQQILRIFGMIPRVESIQPGFPVGKGRRGCRHDDHRRAKWAR